MRRANDGLQGSLLACALSALCAGCSTVGWNSVQEPNLRAVSLSAGQITEPTPPTAQKVVVAPAAAAWSVVDLANKAPLHKKLLAVRVTLDRSSSGPAMQGNSGMLTASLLARLMAAGFGSVQDLSTAPRVTAAVERTSTAGKVSLSGTLADIVPVAAPLRADNVLTVRFVVLPAASASEATRYAISDELLAAYDASQKQYVAALAAAIAQLDGTYNAYVQAFSAAKADYERRGGGYSSFPSKSSGQSATERREEIDKEYQALRGDLQAKQAKLPPAESVRAAAAARLETTAAARERVVAVATLQEQGSNRVLWLGESDTTTEQGESAVVALLDALPTKFPTEKRGTR